MPAALESCVQDVLAKDPSLEESNAYAICNEQLGANFVDYTVDKNGELFLKYFLMDASLAENTHAGDFSVSPEAIDANDQAAIGIPFSVLPNPELSIFGDYHPWNPDPNSTLEQHRAFAKKYAPGYLAAVTKQSNLVSGAIEEIKRNNGRFALIHINDKRARDAYIQNPQLIPKAVSPGIINNDAPKKIGINNFDWAHLAAVPQGAYGDKATLYGKCLGPKNTCLNHLMAAAVASLHNKTNYCPVGASEMLHEASENLLTSHVISNASNSQMSVNANAAEGSTTTTPSVAPTSSAPAAKVTPPTGAPINSATGTPESKGVLKIKTQLQSQVPQTVNLDEYNKLKADYEKFKADQQQNARKEELKRLIPRELFISKGRFDEKAYEAEVDKRLAAGWDNETISDYYNTKIELLKASNPNQYPVNPLGGSRYDYQTPSEVPTLEGGSQVDPVAVKMTNLCKMFGLEVA